MDSEGLNWSNNIGDIWWAETQTPNQKLEFRVKKILHEEKTPYQHLLMIDTYEVGKLLALDNRVQVTDRYEFFYHEGISHPAYVCLDRNDIRVLIIGGGDGGVARELLKYPEVTLVDLVEIDEVVTRVSKEHFPCIWKNKDGQDLDQDPRLKIHYKDGIAFVGEARGRNEHYDLIFVDSTDPIGPAVGLFGRPFYEDLVALAGNNGILVTQAGSLIYSYPETANGLNILKSLFGNAQLYWGITPAYPGGVWVYGFASLDKTVFKNCKNLKYLDKKYEENIARGIKYRYYNSKMHYSSNFPFNFQSE